MTVTRPSISVIIPAFNAAEFLADAVNSIRTQSLQPSEIIIVDDGSTDRTPDVIEALGPDIRSIRQANSGPAAARNRGLELASGNYITFIDADDLWCEGKLESQVRQLEDDPAMQLVIGATQRVRNSGTHSELQPVGPVWMLFHLGAALFRSAVFGSVGGFDESLRQGEDVDWFLRAREAGASIGISEEVVQLYRQHGNNMTVNLQDKDHFFLAALKKSLDRRRADGPGATDLAPIDGLEDFRPKQTGEDR